MTPHGSRGAPAQDRAAAMPRRVWGFGFQASAGDMRSRVQMLRAVGSTPGRHTSEAPRHILITCAPRGCTAVKLADVQDQGGHGSNKRAA
eukprot:6849438-Prymnesium_polylepis.1